MSAPSPEQNVVQAQGPARLVTTLFLGLLLGAGLGPALFLAIDRLQLSGELLLSFAVGAFLTLGVCLVVAGIATLFIVPRIFTNARGTLAGMVTDMTLASRAHAEGDTNRAIDHFGKAVTEGASWYAIGATRRFIAQAAVGLLISFGGLIGAVLLFSQNALLRDQNSKIDQQIELLTQQNSKIDQQTMVADAQKRGAFLTEMFSIIQQVARETTETSAISPELITRIVVLTTSAVPYVYLDFEGAGDDYGPERMKRALSPERGQIISALARTKVKLSRLADAGARFENADLRRADLSGLDFSSVNLTGADFTEADISGAVFNEATLNDAKFHRVRGAKADFSGAHFKDVAIMHSFFSSANFTGAKLIEVAIVGGDFSASVFNEVAYYELAFQNVESRELPSGLPWPELFRTSGSASPGEVVLLSYTFHGEPVPDPVIPRRSIRPNLRP